MGKISKEEQARRDGFEYFAMLYKSQEVRIPIIDEELKRRAITGKPIGISKGAELALCAGIRKNTLQASLIIAIWTLHNKFGFGEIRIDRFMNEYFKTSELIGDDYITFSDIQTALNEETGIEVEMEWFGQVIENQGYSEGK